MKRLAFFALEGRLLQGPHEVWITLGRYPTAELAQGAAGRENPSKAGITETRIMPHYRVSQSTLPMRSFDALAVAPAVMHDSVTVA